MQKIKNKQQGTFSLIESGLTKVAHVSQFLRTEERNNLYEAVCKEQMAFKKIEAPGLDAQTTTFVNLNENEGIEYKGIYDAYLNLNKRIIEQLPFLFEKLCIDPFPVSNIPLTLVNGSHGHYGIPHVDAIEKGKQISILFYFNHIPKVFKGGDLQLFDNDSNSPKGYCDKPFFTIDFEDNILVCFASDTFHGITEVHSNSNNFEDGRFIAVGFIKIPEKKL